MTWFQRLTGCGVIVLLVLFLVDVRLHAWRGSRQEAEGRRRGPPPHGGKLFAPKGQHRITGLLIDEKQKQGDDLPAGHQRQEPHADRGRVVPANHQGYPARAHHPEARAAGEGPEGRLVALCRYSTTGWRCWWRTTRSKSAARSAASSTSSSRTRTDRRAEWPIHPGYRSPHSAWPGFLEYGPDPRPAARRARRKGFWNARAGRDQPLADQVADRQPRQVDHPQPRQHGRQPPEVLDPSAPASARRSAAGRSAGLAGEPQRLPLLGRPFHTR